MTDEAPWENPFGWNLPLTDAMLSEEMPYPPLDDPAESVAERLFLLLHLSFNATVWGGSSGRVKDYWPAFRNRLETATNMPTLSAWWGESFKTLPGVPLRSIPLLHEKNLLTRPQRLPVTQVDDKRVLLVVRMNAVELADRTRAWAHFRRTLRSERVAEAEAIVEDGGLD